MKKASYKGKVAKVAISTIAAFSIITAAQGKENTIQSVEGTFAAHCYRSNGNAYYQFKSNDGKTWWSLIGSEINFVPKSGQQYILTFDNNGTTKDNFVCDFTVDHNCECFLYDDVLISVREK